MQLLQQRAKALAREARRGIRFENRRQLTTRLREALPFTLTGAQTRVLREIFADMCSDRRMQRLLQGDVGSGKTIVALFSALLAMENGFQAAIMAPTELLAEQHARSMGRLLEPLDIAPVLVTGGLRAKRAATSRRGSRIRRRRSSSARMRWCRRRPPSAARARRRRRAAPLRRRAAQGARREGGGAGRAAHDRHADPRSLALTLYGDLDLSIIDERPPGRQAITTALRPEAARERVLQFVDREVATGRQAYVVYPVIEESEKTDLKAATTMYELLAEGTFKDRRVALMHGRVPARSATRSCGASATARSTCSSPPR